MDGYCINCKKIVEMKEIREKTLKNLNKVYEGKCETCETTIYKKRSE